MGIEVVRRVHGPVRITLAVAGWNVRAMTVYERCGFVVVGRHVRRTAGDDREFGDLELKPAAGG